MFGAFPKIRNQIWKYVQNHLNVLGQCNTWYRNRDKGIGTAHKLWFKASTWLCIELIIFTITSHPMTGRPASGCLSLTTLSQLVLVLLSWWCQLWPNRLYLVKLPLAWGMWWGSLPLSAWMDLHTWSNQLCFWPLSIGPSSFQLVVKLLCHCPSCLYAYVHLCVLFSNKLCGMIKSDGALFSSLDSSKTQPWI